MLIKYHDFAAHDIADRETLIHYYTLNKKVPGGFGTATATGYAVAGQKWKAADGERTILWCDMNSVFFFREGKFYEQRSEGFSTDVDPRVVAGVICLPLAIAIETMVDCAIAFSLCFVDGPVVAAKAIASISKWFLDNEPNLDKYAKVVALCWKARCLIKDRAPAFYRVMIHGIVFKTVDGFLTSVYEKVKGTYSEMSASDATDLTAGIIASYADNVAAAQRFSLGKAVWGALYDQLKGAVKGGAMSAVTSSAKSFAKGSISGKDITASLRKAGMLISETDGAMIAKELSDPSVRKDVGGVLKELVDASTF